MNARQLSEEAGSRREPESSLSVSSLVDSVRTYYDAAAESVPTCTRNF